jgi:hypothetical protein
MNQNIELPGYFYPLVFICIGILLGEFWLASTSPRVVCADMKRWYSSVVTVFVATVISMIQTDPSLTGMALAFLSCLAVFCGSIGKYVAFRSYQSGAGIFSFIKSIPFGGFPYTFVPDCINLTAQIYCSLVGFSLTAVIINGITQIMAMFPSPVPIFPELCGSDDNSDDLNDEREEENSPRKAKNKKHTEKYSKNITYNTISNDV